MVKPFTFTKKRVIIASIVVILLIAAILFFLNAGKLLVNSEVPEKADAIVVLMGSGPDRILYGIDLFIEGYADKIIMVENNFPGYELLEERGVDIPRDPELFKMMCLQLGMDEEDIIILAGDAKSTQDEANIINTYFQNSKDYKSILLVTSKFHSARANRVFEDVFDIEIISCPTPYDTFNAEAWWRNRENMKSVFLEYAKWVSYVF